MKMKYKVTLNNRVYEVEVEQGEAMLVDEYELKAYCRGEYGRTPAPINKEVQAKILGDEKPLTGRYADTLPKDIFEKAQAELGDTAKCEEDVLSYISFPPVAEKFFAARKEQEEKKVKYSIVSVD